MSPTHTNKGGLRYRYYASQAMLRKKPQAAGSLCRVPAAELEALVLAALRNHLNPASDTQQLPDSDRDLIERHLQRVTLTANEIRLRLREIVKDAREDRDAGGGASNSSECFICNVRAIAVPWTSPLPANVKGIIHVPAQHAAGKPASIWSRQAICERSTKQALPSADRYPQASSSAPTPSIRSPP